MYIPDNFESLGNDARIAVIRLAKAATVAEYPTTSATGWELARALDQVIYAEPMEQRQLLEQIGKRYGL